MFQFGLFFIIGVFIGILIINNYDEDKIQTITSYIEEFLHKFKNIEGINTKELIGETIKNNLIFAIMIWTAGTTIIGIPIVILLIIYRGICFGFTIGAISLTLGKISSINVSGNVWQ